ncbi:hypothetical protein ACFULT_26425 [Rhodococcus sp. NPDC057297]|uniref:hypothetical protein n=1 Tax=Rhodococcus sp. NPDC057297 TaxID=3346090 RepID=UPI003631DD48
MSQQKNNLVWAAFASGAWLTFLLTLAAINHFFDARWTVLELMGGALLAAVPNLLLFAFQWRMSRRRITAVLALQRQAQATNRQGTR